MIIDKLVAILTYELGSDSEAQKNKYNDGLDQVTDGILNVATIAKAGAVALGVFGTGMLIAANRTANAVDDLGKFAEATGVAFDELQRFKFAGGIFGVTEDQVLSSIGNIQDKLEEFKRGEGDFKLLGQIGVSTGGVDAIGFIDRLANRFQRLSASRAQSLGGKLGLDRNFITLLRQGGEALERYKQEADDLGIVLDSGVASASAEFVDSQFRLKSILQSVQATILSGVIPSILQVTEGFTSWVKENRELIESGIEKFLQVIIGSFRVLGTVMGFVVSIVRSIIGTFQRFEGLAIALGAVMLALGVKMIAPWIGLAAIIGFAAFAIEDFFKFFADPKAQTVTGLLVQGFSDIGATLYENNQLVQTFFDILFKAFDIAVKIGETLGNFAGALAIGAERGNIGEVLSNTGSNLLDAGGDLIDSGVGFVSGAVSNFFGGGDSTSTNNVNGTLDMNVTVTGNTDPVKVGQGIAQQALQEAHRAGLTVQSNVSQ